MWKFNHLDRVAMIYKIHDNIKTGMGGGKRIPQWTFYFFEKAILNSVAEFVHTLFYYRAYCIIFRSKSWKI